MEYREIGDTGLRASLLGIGTMRFKGQDNAVEIIRRALDLGLNYLDCGAAYSFKGDLENAEAWTGAAIQGRKREDMIISAKAQPRASGEQVDRHLGINTRDQMWRCIENSLRRLGVEYLDFYQFWDLSQEEHYQAACAGKDAPMQAMLEAVDQGLVRHLGITTHGTPEAIVGLLKIGGGVPCIDRSGPGSRPVIPVRERHWSLPRTPRINYGSAVAALSSASSRNVSTSARSNSIATTTRSILTT